MISLSLSDILPFLLMGARWTLLLSAIAFLGGGIGALLLLLLRYGRPRFGAKAVHLYFELL
jgi:polar amino acid transport system permease protein